MPSSDLANLSTPPFVTATTSCLPGWRCRSLRHRAPIGTQCHHGRRHRARARTRHAGISCLLVDMRAPGITILLASELIGNPSSPRCSSTSRRARRESRRRADPGGGSPSTMLMYVAVVDGGRSSHWLTSYIDRVLALARRQGGPHRDLELHVRGSANSWWSSFACAATNADADVGLSCRADGRGRFDAKFRSPRPSSDRPPIADRRSWGRSSTGPRELTRPPRCRWTPSRALAVARRPRRVLAIAGGTDQILRNIIGDRLHGLPPLVLPRLAQRGLLPMNAGYRAPSGYLLTPARGRSRNARPRRGRCPCSVSFLRRVLRLMPRIWAARTWLPWSRGGRRAGAASRRARS